MIESADDKPKSTSTNVGAERVALVYAKAFVGAAEKAGQTDRAVEEFADFLRAGLDPFPKLEAVLGSALVSPADKEQILERVFGSKLSRLVLDFLKVITRHGRLDILRTVHVEVQKLYDELRGRIPVELRTATPLADKSSQGITTSLRKLLGGEPKLKSAVDPRVIGGIVLRVGDTVYDGSIARELERLRDAMITRSVHEIQSRRDSFRHPGGN